MPCSPTSPDGLRCLVPPPGRSALSGPGHKRKGKAMHDSRFSSHWIRRMAALAIFGAVISPGPLDSAPPEAASDFEWLRHARVFIVDGYTYPLSPRIEFDAEKLAQTMVSMHANVLRMATSGNYWFIPGTQFETAPDLGQRDLLAEAVAACKPRGIRVVPYVRTGGSVAAEIVKPEWAYRATPDGEIPVRWDLGARRSAFCWNTGYRAAFLDLIEKLVTRYDIDGIYFDAWKLFYRFRSPHVCYCDGCRKGFRRATGLELPYRPDPTQYTGAQRQVIDLYHDWYREEMVEIFRQTKRTIRAHRNIPLIFNLNHARFIRGTTFTDPRIVEESDAFLYEMSRTMLERVEGTSLAISHGLAVWPYSDAYHGYPRIGFYRYGRRQHLYATMAFGGSPTLYHTYFFVDHPEARAPVQEAFGVFARNEKRVAGFRPRPFCAVVWNDLDPPGHARQGHLWNYNARLNSSGAFAACLDRHIQVTSLLKEDLGSAERLSRYEVLYLPDICMLSDRQVETIRQFVWQGGGLVMTYATSLYDASGRRRQDFSLAELAPVRPVEPNAATREKMAATTVFGGTWDVYFRARPGQSVLSPPLADRLMPATPYQPVAPRPGGRVVADVVLGWESEALFPALVVSRYGKGKVAYVSGALGAMYRQTHLRELADLIADVVRWVSPRGLPYEIDAPTGLMANMTARGGTRVLHLVNWTGSKTERPMQNAYYVPPVRDVHIRYRLPHGKSLGAVRLFVPAPSRH
ncbi:MAG TPA: hypothetical protein EYP56_06425, partial [Planctomycetaceae bacterium]|nr:hypothetical protein [Planctomycetaceae bacterium]